MLVPSVTWRQSDTCRVKLNASPAQAACLKRELSHRNRYFTSPFQPSKPLWIVLVHMAETRPNINTTESRLMMSEVAMSNNCSI